MSFFSCDSTHKYDFITVIFFSSFYCLFNYFSTRSSFPVIFIGYNIFYKAGHWAVAITTGCTAAGSTRCRLRTFVMTYSLFSENSKPYVSFKNFIILDFLLSIKSFQFFHSSEEIGSTKSYSLKYLEPSSEMKNSRGFRFLL